MLQLCRSIFDKEGCMKFAVRHFVLGLLISMCFAGSAAAQYMKITTDNPADSLRVRATGTTILNIRLDTNHDKNGSLQSCNSHSASCTGAGTLTNPLDIFSFTIDLV